MNTLQLSTGQVTQSLRARTADYFAMSVPRSVSQQPASDKNPLRRTLNTSQGIDLWVSNENMCVALWELMARC